MEYTYQYPTDPLEFEKLLDEIIISNNYTVQNFHRAFIRTK